MKRDVETYLHDICEAGLHIRQFTEGLSVEDYSADELIKAAVERKFAIIGEALVHISEDAPEVLEKITGAEKIIGFRNVLVHGYDIIDDATVWSAIQGNLNVLLEEIELLKS